MNFEQILALKEKRASKIKQAREILDRADREKRDIRPSEERECDDLVDQADGLGARIEREEKLGSREDEMNWSPGRTTDPDPIHNPYHGNDMSIGGSGSVLRTGDGKEVRCWSREDGPACPAGVESPIMTGDFRGLSIGGFLRAAVSSPRSEVERRALSEGLDSGGGYTVPDVLSAQVIDLLRARSVTAAAGVRIVSLESDNLKIAKLLTDPVASWRAENSAVAESDPTFEAVTFAPKSLAVLTKVSRELLDDSANIEAALNTAFAGALGQELDRVVLIGSGAGNEPAGILGATNVNVVDLNASALTKYDDFVDATNLILTDNAEMPSDVILHPRDWTALMKIRDANGVYSSRPDMMRDWKFHPTSSISIVGGPGTNESTAFVGGFGSVLLGVRQNLRIEVLREAFASSLQVAFVAHIRADVALAEPRSLATINEIVTV